MSDKPTPQELFEALVKANGGKVLGVHTYHRLTGPTVQIPADELPTKWELLVKDDAVIVHIEGSEAAIERMRYAAEKVEMRLEEDENSNN